MININGKEYELEELTKVQKEDGTWNIILKSSGEAIDNVVIDLPDIAEDI